MKHRATMPAPARRASTPPGGVKREGVGVSGFFSCGGGGSYIQAASEKKPEKKSTHGVAGANVLPKKMGEGF